MWPAPGWKPQPRGTASPRRRLGVTGAEFCAGAKILLRALVDLRRGTGRHWAASPAARRRSPALPSRGSPTELRRFPARWAEGLDRIVLPAAENPVSLQPRLRRQSRSVELGQGLQGMLGAGWVGDPPGARGLWQPLPAGVPPPVQDPRPTAPQPGAPWQGLRLRGSLLAGRKKFKGFEGRKKINRKPALTVQKERCLCRPQPDPSPQHFGGRL